jgi:hypothetical protein
LKRNLLGLNFGEIMFGYLRGIIFGERHGGCLSWKKGKDIFIIILYLYIMAIKYSFDFGIISFRSY